MDRPPACQYGSFTLPELAPHLVTEEFTASGFFEDLLGDRAFRQTRRTCPYLRELAELEPTARPDSSRLVRRLPERWLREGVALAPRAVEGA